MATFVSLPTVKSFHTNNLLPHSCDCICNHLLGLHMDKTYDADLPVMVKNTENWPILVPAQLKSSALLLERER